MTALRKTLCLALALCLLCGLAAGASASTFTDAHGNEIELDDTLEAYSGGVLYGADDAARKGRNKYRRPVGGAPIGLLYYTEQGGA